MVDRRCGWWFFGREIKWKNITTAPKGRKLVALGDRGSAGNI
jgi:hypothetical protein